ncbi:hypothetical protein V8E36_004371 [Tilletia maclaganii]
MVPSGAAAFILPPFPFLVMYLRVIASCSDWESGSTQRLPQPRILGAERYIRNALPGILPPRIPQLLPHHQKTNLAIDKS